MDYPFGVRIGTDRMQHHRYRKHSRLFRRHELGTVNRLRINARRWQQHLWHSRLQFVRQRHFFRFARIVEHRHRFRHVGWQQQQQQRYVGRQQQWWHIGRQQRWRHVGWQQRQQIIRLPVARPEKFVGRIVMRCMFCGTLRCALLPSPSPYDDTTPPLRQPVIMSRPSCASRYCLRKSPPA